MKKSIKWFIIGFVMACLMITPMAAFADAIQVTLNSVNINLDGTQVASKGQSYTLDNGAAIPYSLNYNGTVYLPIRKVSELVGKEIAYDGKTSTINISDKNTNNTNPVPDSTKEDTANTDADKSQDTNNTTGNTTGNTGSSTEIKSGFAVINSFMKELNASSIQVNRLVGYLDGTACDMPTSQKDMITFSNAVPSVYSIEYKNNIITKMSVVSADVTDTVKTSSNTYSIEGSKGKYEINSNAVCYKAIMDDDGTIDEYRITTISVSAGDKIYLYDTNGAKGYDIVIVEK